MVEMALDDFPSLGKIENLTGEEQKEIRRLRHLIHNGDVSKWNMDDFRRLEWLEDKARGS